MELTKNQIQKIEKFVSLKLDSLTWHHTQAIRPIAQKLARQEKADKEIVEVAVLFHDIGKVKGCAGHSQRSAEMARKFLEKEKYEQRFVEEVVYCIACHELPWQGKSSLVKTKEAQVLCDADMIQQLSPFGIIKHAIRYRELFNNDYQAGLKKIWEKLMKAYNVIITDNGRKMAEEGYKFVKDFYKDLL